MSTSKNKTSIYERLGFTPDEIYTAARTTYDELIDFVTQPKFKSIIKEIEEMPDAARPKSVWDLILDEDNLRERGVEVPEGILIQRSTFGDRRPTLFCVKKYLPEKFHSIIQNVNITFDNPHRGDIPEDKRAWREPLPVELQALSMSAGENLESIPDEIGVSMVDSNPYEKVDLIRGNSSILNK